VLTGGVTGSQKRRLAREFNYGLFDYTWRAPFACIRKSSFHAGSVTYGTRGSTAGFSFILISSTPAITETTLLKEIKGRKVGDDVICPAYTDFHRRKAVPMNFHDDMVSFSNAPQSNEPESPGKPGTRAKSGSVKNSVDAYSPEPAVACKTGNNRVNLHAEQGFRLKVLCDTKKPISSGYVTKNSVNAGHETLRVCEPFNVILFAFLRERIRAGMKKFPAPATE
jgi:hypothetical protein